MEVLKNRGGSRHTDLRSGHGRRGALLGCVRDNARLYLAIGVALITHPQLLGRRPLESRSRPDHQSSGALEPLGCDARHFHFLFADRVAYLSGT